MNITVQNSVLKIADKTYQCSFGKNGFTTNKTEGDNKTPIGTFAIRRVFYRGDKTEKPNTCLNTVIIKTDMGWADDCKDIENYNKLITFPYDFSAEKMHRDDDVYDIVVELGYNDCPAVIGKGSAIFFHIARPTYQGTEGCIAVTLPHMQQILKTITPDSQFTIKPPL